MEGGVGGAAGLEVLDEGLDLLPVGVGLASEEEAAEPAFLAAERDADDAAEDVLPLIGVADPGLDAGIVVDIFETGREIGVLDEELASLAELDTGTEDLPAGVVNGHHLVAGVDVEVADVDAVGRLLAEGLKNGFAEGTKDFSACAA